MPFSCACREHATYSNGKESFVHKIANKKIKADILYYMKSNNLLPNNSRAVCQLCIDFVSNLSKKRKFSEVDDVIGLIENGQLDAEDMRRIAEALGSRVKIDIDNDILKNKNVYKNVSEIESVTASNWLQKANPIVLGFIMSITGCKLNNNAKKDMLIVTAIDNIHKARNLNFFAPLPFYDNLLSYYVSGSKTITEINNKKNAGGSYQTIKRWINDVSHEVKPVDSNSDIVTYFDNNQVIARNWRVTYGHKNTASVITMLININPLTDSAIQFDDTLSPRNWLYNVPNEPIDKVTCYLKEGEGLFDKVRNKYVGNLLQKACRQVNVIDGVCTDPVAERIHGIYGPINKVKEDDPYEWVPSMHGKPPAITVCEPAMINPCSYQSVTKVLKHIIDINRVGPHRKWASVGCDGLPYVLGRRLIEKNDELKDIMLIPGHGHLEMTAVKACFRLLWDVGLQELAYMLGFKSPRAQLCCKTCTDHHKSWMILNIFFKATMDEIVCTYLSYATVNNISPTVQGLYTFVSKSDSNFRFICDVSFNFILAIMVFRSGVRRNNSEYIMAGKCKFYKLFFGLNHTTYQEIIYRDIKTRVLAPPEVHTFIKQTEAFSTSGHTSKGEGGDFVLEAFNKRAKRWLPPGIPEEKHWLKVCRTIDVLEKIKTQKEKSVHNESIYQRDITTEVMEWRVRLRKAEYLTNLGETDQRHCSISGVVLDSGLLSFETTCQNNFQRYMTGIKDGNASGKNVCLEPVFITPLDRSNFHDIQKKTKLQISTIVEQMILDIIKNNHKDEALILQSQWNGIKIKTKKDMLEFYKEVVTALENSTAEEEFDEEDSSDDGDDE